MNPLDHLDSLADLINCSRAVSEAFKIWIISGGLLLLAAWRFLPRRAALIALLLVNLVATANYARWGGKLVARQVDTYDLIHYYLNSKYFDELGYYDLYPAAILADHDNGGPRFKEGRRYLAQNDAGHGFMPIEHALERGRKVRDERFSPERWHAFEHDLLVLQRELPGMSDKLWRQMIQDHGYNGTPAWTWIARPLSSRVPVESVKLLGFLDLGLLLLGVAAIAWAYGTGAALWTWLFMMVSYSLRWPTITWAFLRYDYVVALLFGLALLKKRGGLSAFGAGLATAYAAAMRLFPALWMFGPGMKGLFGLWGKTAPTERGKRVDRRLVILALGFVVGLIAIESGTTVDLGFEATRVHFQNMANHTSSKQLSSRRIGLALALPFTGDLEPRFIEDARKEKVEAQKPLRYGIAFATMLLLGWGLRRSRDDEAYAFGFVPFFLLTTASYYYYVTRITLVAMHAGDLKKVRNQVGLAMLLGIELFSNWAESVHPGYRVFHIGWLAWALAAYVVVMTVWFNVEALRGGTDEREA